MLVACLGETKGNEVYELALAGTLEDGHADTTDTGNSFVVMNKNGVLTIRVTCSEKVEEEPAEGQEAEGDAESTTADTQETAQEPEEAASTTSSVIGTRLTPRKLRKTRMGLRRNRQKQTARLVRQQRKPQQSRSKNSGRIEVDIEVKR